MDYRLLEEFVALVENGDLKRTANKFSISKATLQRHIKSLESEIGSSLFAKQKDEALFLTSFGESFLEYSYSQLVLLSNGKKALSDAYKKTDAIKIGVTVSTPLPIQTLLLNYTHLHANAQISAADDDRERLLENLSDHTLDACFVHSATAITDEKFVVIPYARNRLVAALPGNSLYSSEYEIPLSGLTTEKYLSYSYLESDVQHYISKCGLHLEAVCTTTQLSYIFSRVASGDGFSILLNSSQEYAQQIRYIPVIPTMSYEHNIVFLKSNSNPALPSLIDYFFANITPSPMLSTAVAEWHTYKSEKWRP